MNVLRDTLIEYRAKFVTRCFGSLFWVAGYTILFFLAGWQMVGAIFLIQWAGEISMKI